MKTIMRRIEARRHRRCESAMSRLRADLIAMNAEKAQLAQNLVSAIRYADELAEQLNATVSAGE